MIGEAAEPCVVICDRRIPVVFPLEAPRHRQPHLGRQRIRRIHLLKPRKQFPRPRRIFLPAESLPGQQQAAVAGKTLRIPRQNFSESIGCRRQITRRQRGPHGLIQRRLQQTFFDVRRTGIILHQPLIVGERPRKILKRELTVRPLEPRHGLILGNRQPSGSLLKSIPTFRITTPQPPAPALVQPGLARQRAFRKLLQQFAETSLCLGQPVRVGRIRDELFQPQFAQREPGRVVGCSVRLLAQKLFQRLRGLGDLIQLQAQFRDLQHRRPLAIRRHVGCQIAFQHIGRLRQSAGPFQNVGLQRYAFGQEERILGGMCQLHRRFGTGERRQQIAFGLLHAALQMAAPPGCRRTQFAGSQPFERPLRTREISLGKLRLAQDQIPGHRQLAHRSRFDLLLERAAWILQQTDHPRPLRQPCPGFRLAKRGAEKIRRAG